MPAAADLKRSQLLAYRILASGLDRTQGPIERLALWELGLQDRTGTAAQALAARVSGADLGQWLAGPPTVGEPAEQTTFALAWTWRGSPHFHRRADLPRVAAALWPADEKDAIARLGGSGRALSNADEAALDGYREVSAAMRRIVTEPSSKSAVSTAATAAVPSFATWCRPCGVEHVPEMLFRSAPLFAGLGLVPGKPATLAPLDPVLDRPAGHGGQDAFVRIYLEQYGAGTMAEAADFLGVAAGRVRPGWPATVPVVVDGIRLQTSEALLAAVVAADAERAAQPVRLLPPGDPLLQPRERAVTIPDKAAWKVLWPPIGPAGAVLAAGGLAGSWRTRKVGRSLQVTVSPFSRLPAATRSAVEVEAQLVGLARGVDAVQVDFDG